MFLLSKVLFPDFLVLCIIKQDDVVIMKWHVEINLHLTLNRTLDLK